MDDSIIYTEEIIEDSIKVRSPSILEIAELQHGSTDKENPADNGTSAKEFKDASVQTLLTLVNDHTPADDLECFSDASYEEGSSDSNKVFEIKTLNHWEISRESNFEIPKSRKTIERMANSPSSSVSSAKPGTNCCHEEQNLVTPPSPPRSFKQSYGSKQHEKNQDEELAIASRGFKTPVSTQNSLYPIAFDKNAVGSMHNMKKQDELKKEGTRDDSAGISEHSIGANCVFIPDRILRIVRNVQLNSSHLESRNNENKVSTCLCSAKESSLRHASSCCSNLHKLHNEFRLHNFRSSIRQELLAIRRRLVARTASPQVAKALPYLLEAPYRNFARNPNEQC